MSLAGANLLTLASPGASLADSTKAAEANDGSPIVIGRSYHIPSRILGDDRVISIYLPPHYDDRTRRFPVLYLLDGGAAEDFHHVTGLAAVSSAYGTTKEMIIVGIEGRDRRRDLTSPTTDPGDLKSAPTAGGAATYRRFLFEELRPWVEARYRTDGRTALMGESLAGLFVVETVLTAPRMFDDYIAVSPSLWWNRGALSLAAPANLAQGDFRGRRLWLAVGDEPSYYPEMKDGLDRLVAALRAAGTKAPVWSMNPMPAETHSTIYHPAAMAAFRALFAAPKVER